MIRFMMQALLVCIGFLGINTLSNAEDKIPPLAEGLGRMIIENPQNGRLTNGSSLLINKQEIHLTGKEYIVIDLLPGAYEISRPVLNAEENRVDIRTNNFTVNSGETHFYHMVLKPSDYSVAAGGALFGVVGAVVAAEAHQQNSKYDLYTAIEELPKSDEPSIAKFNVLYGGKHSYTKLAKEMKISKNN